MELSNLSDCTKCKSNNNSVKNAVYQRRVWRNGIERLVITQNVTGSNCCCFMLDRVMVKTDSDFWSFKTKISGYDPVIKQKLTDVS